MSSTNLSHRSQLSITIIPKLSGFLSTLNPFRAVLGTTHDIYHLLLIGTAKFHTEPIHIVVYGQCLAALMIFAICYWLGLPRSTLTPSTSWCTGSACPLSWYLPFTIDWVCLLLSCIWDCFRAHDIYPQLIGTACRAHVFETACRAHDIYHSLLIGTACRSHVFETARHSWYLYTIDWHCLPRSCIWDCSPRSWYLIETAGIAVSHCMRLLVIR